MVEALAKHVREIGSALAASRAILPVATNASSVKKPRAPMLFKLVVTKCKARSHESSTFPQSHPTTKTRFSEPASLRASTLIILTRSKWRLPATILVLPWRLSKSRNCASFCSETSLAAATPSPLQFSATPSQTSWQNVTWWLALKLGLERLLLFYCLCSTPC